MFNPIDRFRVDLTTVVRRLSRSQSHETAIDEMVSHFDGLYQEEHLVEPNEKIAERKARKRMGSHYKIAFQIVNSPDRVKKGIWLQACMFILFAAFIPVFVRYLMGSDTLFLSHRGNFNNTFTALLLGGGFVAGLGISVVKRIAWKPLAITTIISIVGTGQMLNNMSYSDPRMTKMQLTALVEKQAVLEPRVARIEAQVKNILKLRDQSPEAWKKELKALPALVKEGNVPFYIEDQRSTGSYLYPSETKYNIDKSITYSMTLSRTDDLAMAQNSWNKYQATFEDRFVDFRSREELYKLYGEDAANYSVLWMKGFKFSGGVCLRLGAFFSLFALLGFLLGSARVFGLDWLRGVRA
ncbi:MAG: hypothetical protein WCG75_11295 [Armatimonadota bacterium]